MNRLLTLALLLLVAVGIQAQTGIYIPSQKPVRNMKKALVEPDLFCLLIVFNGNDSTVQLSDLDLLDSVYDIAFSKTNPKLYTMTIEGYGDADQFLTKERVDNVFKYFAQRTYSPFPVRYAPNPVSCSCHGDTIEQVRFEVPVSTRIYDCGDLPESRLFLNKTIALRNSVLITFRHNPEECIGLANGCYLPGQDTTIRGYYSAIEMPKGAVYSVRGTKDSCPEPLQITIDEHLDYNSLVERYFLVPHKKKIIAQAGYLVLKSNFNRKPGECEQPLPDSINVRIPITQAQWDNKLRVYGKVQTDHGPEYRMLRSRKITNRTTKQLYLQVSINATQFDTLYFAKTVKAEEIKDYFYVVDSDRESGSFEYKGKYYMAYRMNRRGEYESKKALKVLFHTAIETDEPETEENTTPYDEDENIKDD